jgi:hypothetical protein
MKIAISLWLPLAGVLAAAACSTASSSPPNTTGSGGSVGTGGRDGDASSGTGGSFSGAGGGSSGVGGAGGSAPRPGDASSSVGGASGQGGASGAGGVSPGAGGAGGASAGSGGGSPDSGANRADGGSTNTISGSATGSPFSTVATALWIGAPDDPTTTVIFLFSQPVACSAISAIGWDARITNATQVLEMKEFGTTPRTYTVVTTLTPAPGEASVNYTLSSTAGTPTETSSSGGTVTLSTLTANTNATGSFALTFGAANALNGTFNATFCPAGVEP